MVSQEITMSNEQASKGKACASACTYSTRFANSGNRDSFSLAISTAEAEKSAPVTEAPCAPRRREKPPRPQAISRTCLPWTGGRCSRTILYQGLDSSACSGSDSKTFSCHLSYSVAKLIRLPFANG